VKLQLNTILVNTGDKLVIDAGCGVGLEGRCEKVFSVLGSIAPQRFGLKRDGAVATVISTVPILRLD
jgi:hypothetical protein